MNFSIFKIFQIFGIVSNWAAKALADGKITLEEAVDLAMKIADILGVKIELEVPDAITDSAIVESPVKEKSEDLAYDPDAPPYKPIED